MNTTRETLWIALGATTNAMHWFSKEHPQYIKLEQARDALIKELENENQTNK